MKIEKNNRKLCGEKSRNMHIIYFFTKYILVKENVESIQCPAGRTVSDFNTKPLQGSLFRKMRDIVMGLTISKIRVCCK